MSFPEIRMRRLRSSDAMRRLVRETALSVDERQRPQRANQVNDRLFPLLA
jgi:delta-aminolevulinic acid dehydratase/porphobilinogen synthase